jgi:HK97 family phage major capsid protein
MAVTFAAKNSNELMEMLTNGKTSREILSDPKNFGEWVHASINSRLTEDKGISNQVKEQTEAFMSEWLKGNKGAQDALEAKRINLTDPNNRGKVVHNSIYNKNAIGAPHDDAFENLAEMFYSVSAHSFKDAALQEKLGKLQNDLSSVRPSDGGYLIPEVLRAEILRTSLETSIVRPRARVIPMDNPIVPFPTIDSTSNVSSIYGGVVGYWTEEGATLTESQPRFGRVQLHAHKLALYTEVPNELIRDARPAMDAFVTGVFPEATGWFEDVAFFVGSGVGEPLGFRNAPCTVSVTRSTTVAGANVEWVDIVNMYARMLPQSLSRAVWVISPDVLPDLLTMTIASGVGAVLIGGGGFPAGSSAPAMTILGRPVIVSEKCNTVGHIGDINFIDFGFYLIGDLQAMSIAQSEDFRFQNDVTSFRCIERLDGRPWLASAITPQNNGNTLSPFVNLSTHA